jgi:hypothetical protein
MLHKVFQIFVVIFVHLKVFLLVFMLCSEVCLFIHMFSMSGLLLCVIVYQPVKLAVVGCTIVLGHQMLLNGTSI